ncbi:hypothetical protein JZ751_008709 [Albula glossodonta]|uniref:T-cell surface glycoprotein CD5 n=1 Tax=Albula glossodonta TaxID=121402 RepID=A0A8T2NYY8_9TELE|nr:hypothetical protein JZ751_008709 [Albula glossodonta]
MCPTDPPCPTCPAPVTCPTPGPPPPPPPPKLGVLSVKPAEGSTCQGRVYLTLNRSLRLPLCFQSALNLQTLCLHLGCGKYRKKILISSNTSGHHVHGNWSLEETHCNPTDILCEAAPDSKELVAYKVVTGLLAAIFLLLLLLRFGPPTWTLIRKRLLNRGSTWIGPTQSQSVSFYRAQQKGLQPNSTDKRHSYPGLERLTVNNSRNPSNRNSYDSYN